MFKDFLLRNNCLATQLLFSLLCCTVAFLLVGYPLIMTNSLYHDYYTIYSFFRNSFLSVLQFGEIRWWDPSVQYGFPSYYFSFLGLYGGSPLFWATEGLLFLLHLMGIRDFNILPLVIFYIAFLVPFLFSLSFLALARQIFRSNTTILLTVVLAAFSPGLVFSVSDVTFEMTAYGIFTAAALLALSRDASSKNYLVFNLACCFLLLSFNHLSLYWNPLFLVLFLITLLLFPENKWRAVKPALAAIPISRHGLFLVTMALCSLPTVFCYLDGAEIFRSGIGKRLYDPLSIYGGNPLEFLLSGVPGAAITRTADLLTGLPRLIPTGNYAEYLYIGTLTLPLALLGLTFGQKPWSYRFLILLAFFSIAALLGGQSSILSILYLPESPFRAVRHFGDTTFRNGLFALIILTAGLGFEALIFSRAKKIRLVFFASGGAWLLTIVGIAAAALFLTIEGKIAAEMPMLGFMVTICFFYLPFLLWVWLKPGFGKTLQLLLACIMFLDVASTLYLFVRYQVLPQASTIVDDNNPFEVADTQMYRQENAILMLKDILALKEQSGFDPDVPYLGLASSSGIVPLGPDTPSQMSYNSLSITVSTDESAILFWRDSWFKGWRATVNGKIVSIEKSMGAFKAVPVGKGQSKVQFEFRPSLFINSLIAGWSCILLLLILLTVDYRKRAAMDLAITKSLAEKG